MLNEIDIQNILFLDIETVPAFPGYPDLPEHWKKLWDTKAKSLTRNPDDDPEKLYPRAGIYSEFGKVICIAVGYFQGSLFRMASFFGDDEVTLLREFGTALSRFFSKRYRYLCAHNGKEFDFPYLARRMLINGIELPDVLSTAGSKPWEVPHLDTMELWRFGDFKNYTSLDLLATVFDIASPKSDITGADVFRVYWTEHDLERIAAYCRQDVLALARIYLALSQVPGPREFETEVVDHP